MALLPGARSTPRSNLEALSPLASRPSPFGSPGELDSLALGALPGRRQELWAGTRWRTRPTPLAFGGSPRHDPSGAGKGHRWDGPERAAAAAAAEGGAPCEFPGSWASAYPTAAAAAAALGEPAWAPAPPASSNKRSTSSTSSSSNKRITISSSSSNSRGLCWGRRAQAFEGVLLVWWFPGRRLRCAWAIGCHSLLRGRGGGSLRLLPAKGSEEGPRRPDILLGSLSGGYVAQNCWLVAFSFSVEAVQKAALSGLQRKEQISLTGTSRM